MNPSYDYVFIGVPKLYTYAYMHTSFTHAPPHLPSPAPSTSTNTHIDIYIIVPFTMPRSDEAEAFFYGVYSAVQEIPYGKVTTYGHIAALIGTRKSSLSSRHIVKVFNITPFSSTH